MLTKYELKLESEEPMVKKGEYKNSIELVIPNFLIDLKPEEEIIFRRIQKSTRADIRKAIDVDKCCFYEIENPNNEQIKTFSSLYNSFAKEKKIAICNIEKLIAIRDKNSLIMTYVTDIDKNILCTSMLVVDRDSSQLYGLYGLSTHFMKSNPDEKRKIGRANKYLQWREILLAKSKGLNWYNFGGEVNQEGSLGVNDFKRRFGTIRGYDHRLYIPVSFLGKIYVYLINLKWKRCLRTK
ncbi:hypothetical protein SM124_01655 [Bacillus sp. 31A1R]|uniref:FemAB family protein n=1 Tax=Robertmurraya mangrovi TaxID=3098077 RepID=A0ABU5ITJ5_9BACI|nr:hypothetical protein [Bacillus sp. 31A1R]